MEQIRRNPQITYDELALAANKHRDTIRAYMKRLRTEFHLIERVGSDKNGYWRILSDAIDNTAKGTPETSDNPTNGKEVRQ